MRILIFILINIFSVVTIFAQSNNNIDLMLLISLNKNHSVFKTHPINMLYNYKDGGFQSDLSNANLDFDEETDVMLQNIEDNLDKRIINLKNKYKILSQKIITNSEQLFLEDISKLTATNSLNHNISRTLEEPQVIFTVQEFQKFNNYLKQVNSFKALSIRNLDKALRDRKLNIEAISDLKIHRENLLNETNWHSSSEAALIASLALNINATTNLIYDLLAIDPRVSNNPAIKTIGILKSTFEESLMKGQIDAVQIQKAFGEAYLIDGITSGSNLLQVTNTFYGLGKSIALMTQIDGDHKELRKTIKTQLDAIDIQINKYNENINKATKVIELRNHIIESINNYLTLNNISSEFQYVPLGLLPDIRSIPPLNEIFNFDRLDSRNTIYNKHLTFLDKQLKFQKGKNKYEYSLILERFNEFRNKGEEDSVFKTLADFEANKRKSDMCLEFSEKINQNFENIKELYPNTDKNLISNWIKASKKIMYEAKNYMPLVNDIYRFTPVDINNMRTEMIKIISFMENEIVIPSFASNIYTAKLVSIVYNIDENIFKKENGTWFTSNELAIKAMTKSNFNRLGFAIDQKTLDKASYFATIGKPVIAIYYNDNGYGHVNLILPGLNTIKSVAWNKYVPLVTNYSLTPKGDCNKCYLEGKISDAFSYEKAKKTIIYVIEN